MTTTKSGTGNQSVFMWIAVGAAVVFLGLLLFVIFGLWKPDVKEGEAKLQEAIELRENLEKDYYQALSDLEELRGSNEELNALIDKQVEELKGQKDQIDKLLKDNRNLGAARQQIKALNAKAEQYLAEINQLRQEKEELIAKTNELSEVNQNLSTSLQETQATAAELSTAKQQLESQKSELEQKTELLSRKVNIASVVKVKDVEVTGYKIRGSGKAVKKRSADNVDQLQVCFNTTANEVTESSTELFLVRILNPQGETLAIENLGSGVFQDNQLGQSIRYTKAKEIPYANDENSVCVNWSPGQAFQEGVYTIEIYNKGYLAGTTNFELK